MKQHWADESALERPTRNITTTFFSRIQGDS